MQENPPQSAAPGQTPTPKPRPVQAIVLHYQDQRIELTPGSPVFYLGRRSNSDMIINQKYASRNHARIECRDDSFVLIDQSKNGSFVKTLDGVEHHLLMDEIALQDSGFISLGCPVEQDNPHLISFFCL